MKRADSSACARAWEIGAWRDGRLRPNDVESLRRHLPACASCATEHARLEAIGEALRELPPVPDDALAARRLRHRLLGDVNASMVSQAPRRSGAWRVAAAGAIAACLVSAGLVGYRAWKPAARQPVTRLAAASFSVAPASVAPLLDVVATDGARFRKQELGRDLVFELSDGEVRLAIGAHETDQQVRIQLPDGWIEDLGTVLIVAVQSGHTRSVRVLQGRVLLHLDERAPFELAAGEGWSAPAATSTHSAVPPAVSMTAPRRKLVPAAPVATVVPVATVATAAVTVTSSAHADSAAAERAAREEDEAYLHIVALLRARQTDDARAAAKQYLARFPSGFRREEVAGVAAK